MLKQNPAEVLGFKAFITISLFLSYAYATDCDLDDSSFPADLMIGAATAAYQVEGAWNEGGKLESIWDRFSQRTPSLIRNGDTGDVACDSYHKYEDDVEVMKDIGFNHYRFSIAWPRVLSSGYGNDTNKEGIQYYHNLIDALLANGITPLVTIYHWDLPQKLQDLGGWANPNIIDYFEQYAKILFNEYGSKVKYWITINEPFQIASGYSSATKFAPGIEQLGVANYLAVKNLLVAHAKVYHLYNNCFKPTQQGLVGITIDCEWYVSKTDCEDDIKAADRQMEFEWGIFANPIFSKEGDFPVIVKEQVARLSKEENWEFSRLPQFTAEEIKSIVGSSDFFGMNHYGSRQSSNGEGNGDAHAVTSYDPSWPNSTAPVFKSVPWGFRKVLNRIREKYNNPKVFVTENGWSSDSGIKDYDRVKFHHAYLKNMLAAIHKDGCNVIGYTMWSLLDNFSWSNGYSRRFGVVHVDMNSCERTRTKKLSADFFKKIAATRKLPELEEFGCTAD